MNKFISLLLSVLLGLLFNSITVYGQETPDSSSLYQVETIDGNIYVGKILSKDENQVVLDTKTLGEIKIRFQDVKMMKVVAPDNLYNGVPAAENLHSTRYFYLPNGYGLEKGEGYYQNTWVLFNQVSYGFTNNFSMGVGLIPTFLFGTSGAPVWITPKLSFPLRKDKWNLGLGAITGTYIGDESDDTPIVGLVYGVSTFGPRDKNITLGAGYGFADGEWSDVPVLSVAGTIRTGKKHYFLTENYFIIGEGETVVMMWLGGRVAARYLAVDYGFIIPTGADLNRMIAIPWLSLTVPFGNRQKAYVPER